MLFTTAFNNFRYNHFIRPPSYLMIPCGCRSLNTWKSNFSIGKQLKSIQATLKIIAHNKQIYACRNYNDNGERGTIILAKTQNTVLPSSLVNPSLLSILMDMKYNKMLPLYRQEKSFEELWIDIPRQNIASWIMKISEKHLKPQFDCLHYPLNIKKILFTLMKLF